MAYETVTGYCWPQSVAGGERVALHLASSGVRPVDVEVAHIGATRTVVYSEAGIPVGGSTDAPFGHPDPWRDVAAAIERRTAGGELAALFGLRSK